MLTLPGNSKCGQVSLGLQSDLAHIAKAGFEGGKGVCLVDVALGVFVPFELELFLVYCDLEQYMYPFHKNRRQQSGIDCWYCCHASRVGI